jgi:hypothetical protein
MGFTGPFDPGTWTTTFVGTLNLVSGGGPGSTTMTSSTLTIMGGDTGAGIGTGCASGLGTCEIQITHAGSTSPVAFHWSYSTADDPTFDPFGVLVNGQRTPLANTDGASGDMIIGPGASFGFFINCTDCTSGAATAGITDFRVPEPGSLALLGVAMAAGLCGLRRRSHESLKPR